MQNFQYYLNLYSRFFQLNKCLQNYILDRILQVADVTSALSLTRSYQEAKSSEVVVEILEKLAETHELDISCVKKIKSVLLDQNNNKSESAENHTKTP